MLLLFAVFLLHFSLAIDDVKARVGEEGLIDERTTYIPLGWNHIFPCQAKLMVAHLTKVDPKWNILYFEDGVVNAKKVVVKSINEASNDRFRVYDNGSLMAFGLQKRHEGVVVECEVEMSSNKIVISRNIIAIQDCRGGSNKDEDRRNPCLFGMCDRWGIKNHFEAIRCNCSAYYTGQFCDQRVDGVLFHELLFFSPLITMLLGLVVLYFCSDGIEFAGKEKKMKLEQHIPSTNRIPNLRSLFPASALSQRVIQQVELDALSMSTRGDGGGGSGDKQAITIKRNSNSDDSQRSSERKYMLTKKELMKVLDVSLDLGLKKDKKKDGQEIKEKKENKKSYKKDDDKKNNDDGKKKDDSKKKGDCKKKDGSKKSDSSKGDKKKGKKDDPGAKVLQTPNNNMLGVVDRMSVKKKKSKKASKILRSFTPPPPSASQLIQ